MAISKLTGIGAILAAGLALGAGALPANAACLDDIKARGVIVSAVGLMGTKPYVWKDEKTGKYEGFEPEMLDQIVKRMGVPKWEYAVTEWTTMIPGPEGQPLGHHPVGHERHPGAHPGRGHRLLEPLLHALRLRHRRGRQPDQDDGRPEGQDARDDRSARSTRKTASMIVDAGKAGKLMDFNTFNEPFVALANKQVDAVMLDQATFLGMQQDMGRPAHRRRADLLQPQARWVEAEKAAPYKLRRHRDRHAQGMHRPQGRRQQGAGRHGRRRHPQGDPRPSTASGRPSRSS